jgi:hypothetical protein
VRAFPFFGLKILTAAQSSTGPRDAMRSRRGSIEELADIRRKSGAAALTALKRRS